MRADPIRPARHLAALPTQGEPARARTASDLAKVRGAAMITDDLSDRTAFVTDAGPCMSVATA